MLIQWKTTVPERGLWHLGYPFHTLVNQLKVSDVVSECNGVYESAQLLVFACSQPKL
jgi:hypothetical protein